MPSPSYRETEIAILSVVEEAGGSAKPSDVYPAVTARFPKLTDDDMRSALPSGGNRWANRIQWARQSLVVSGQLNRKPRGLWCITDAGRARLKKEGSLAVRPASVTRVGESPVVELQQENLHRQLQKKLQEIGHILGKFCVSEYPEGPYQYDVVWKEDQNLARASHVFEIQHHGNLADALLKLKHAHDVWRSRLFLVVTGEKDRRRVDQILGPLFSGVFHEIRSDTIPLTPEEVDELHDLLKSHEQMLRQMLSS